MVTQLGMAARVVGLTYRILSTTTMIGFLVVGVGHLAREAYRNRNGG